MEGVGSPVAGDPGLRSGFPEHQRPRHWPTLGGQGMDVVVPQPELSQLTAEALLVCDPVPIEVHGAVTPSLEHLWGAEGPEDGPAVAAWVGGTRGSSCELTEHRSRAPKHGHAGLATDPRAIRWVPTCD